jgi:peptidyl-prolyl cis-trans isomerase B (cyclophilin B)
MPDRRRTRERQLAKLAQRRAAERRKKHRQRVAAALVGVGLTVVVIVVLLVAFTGGKAKPIAAPSATPSATASPTAGVACGGKAPKANSIAKKKYKNPPKMTIDTSKKYLMTMKTSCGAIKIELDPMSAPNTVNSLVYLADHGFFDGLIFHRTVQDFVIQGGDPLTVKGNDPATFGSGGPGYKTTDAPPAGATYPEGTVAMAKGQTEPAGTSGSQFFIVTGASADAALAPGGTGQYAIVGKVTSGLDIAKKIELLPRAGGSADGRPAQDVYILKVTVKVET